MFTGLVEKVGKIVSADDRRGQRRVRIKTGWNDLQLGESVSVNGVCLTVAEADAKGEALFFVSEESLDRSNLGKLEPESTVNMERAMQLGDRMGGHWVQGHVDTKGLVLNIVPGHDHHKLTVALDPKYGRYCVEKGSITIDGVSLTINQLIETKLNEFMVTFLIVPHTWKNTTFSELKAGSYVNVEVDVLAKYIERLCPQLNQVSSLLNSITPAMPAEALAAMIPPPAEAAPEVEPTAEMEAATEQAAEALVAAEATSEPVAAASETAETGDVPAESNEPSSNSETANL
jgi:riboflavin synthase